MGFWKVNNKIRWKVHDVKQKPSKLCSYKDVHLSPFTFHPFPFRSFSEEALSIQTMMLVACLRSPAAAMDKAPWPDFKDTTLKKMKTKHESTPFEKEYRGNHSPPTPSKPSFQIH